MLVAFTNFIEPLALGEAFSAPYDAFLDENANAVQPDLFFISTERLPIAEEKGVYGAPDLIVEMLSQSNERYDLIKKKELYEKFGVKEYWVVNPLTKESTGFFLKDRSYDTPVKHQAFIKSLLLNHEFHF